MTEAKLRRSSLSLHVRRAQIALFGFFAFGGAAYALWAVHIAQFEAKFGLSHTQMSWIMLLFGVGAFAAMQVVGPMIDRYGSRTGTWLGGAMLGLATISIGISSSPWILAASVLAFGFFMGTMDVTMNAHSVEVERQFNKTIFTLFHAMWSFGGLGGAAIGFATLRVEWDASLTLSIYGTIVALASVALRFWLLPNSPSKQPENKTEAKEHAAENRRYLPYVLLLGVLATSAGIGEGTAIDWSALHLHSTLGATEYMAANAVVGISLAMGIMRLVGDRIVDRFDRITVIQWGSAISGSGYLIALLSNNVPQSLIGWAIAGIGVSAVIPQFFALAGNVGNPTHQGRNMAKVVGMVYVGLMAGPALIGLLNQWLPLERALLTGAVLFAIVVLGMPFAKSMAKKLEN